MGLEIRYCVVGITEYSLTDYIGLTSQNSMLFSFVISQYRYISKITKDSHNSHEVEIYSKWTSKYVHRIHVIKKFRVNFFVYFCLNTTFIATSSQSSM